MPVTLARNVKNPRAVKILHSQRYNLTLGDPCSTRQPRRCSHICLLLPKGRTACACPNGQSFADPERTTCNAAQEQPKPQPLVCKCQNGGVCLGGSENADACACPDNFSGRYCQIGAVPLTGVGGDASPAVVIVPVILIVIIVLVLIGLYIYWRDPFFMRR